MRKLQAAPLLPALLKQKCLTLALTHSSLSLDRLLASSRCFEGSKKQKRKGRAVLKTHDRKILLRVDILLVFSGVARRVQP